MNILMGSRWICTTATGHFNVNDIVEISDLPHTTVHFFRLSDHRLGSRAESGFKNHFQLAPASAAAGSVSTITKGTYWKCTAATGNIMIDDVVKVSVMDQFGVTMKRLSDKACYRFNPSFFLTHFMPNNAPAAAPQPPSAIPLPIVQVGQAWECTQDLKANDFSSPTGYYSFYKGEEIEITKKGLLNYFDITTVMGGYILELTDTTLLNDFKLIKHNASAAAPQPPTTAPTKPYKAPMDDFVPDRQRLADYFLNKKGLN